MAEKDETNIFDWDRHNRAHLARHHVTPEEAEQVIANDPLDLDIATGGDELRTVNLGETDSGRILVVVAAWRGESVRVVTAYPASKRLRESRKREPVAFMKKLSKQASPLKPPRFRNEAEESRWWYEHQNELADEFDRRAAAGELSQGSIARRGQIPTTTIRLDPRDIARARTLAKRKGLRYQTYLKMLLHEALTTEEERATS